MQLLVTQVKTKRINMNLSLRKHNMKLIFFLSLVKSHKQGAISTADYYDEVVKINTKYNGEYDLPGALQPAE